MLLCLALYLQTWDGGLAGAQIVTCIAAALIAVRMRGDTLQVNASLRASIRNNATSRAETEQAPLIDLDFHTDDGEQRRYWQASCYPLQLEDREGVSLVLQDTTENKRTQQEILTSKERYELASKGASDGLWDWALRKQTIPFSARWKAMLGYSSHEIGDQPKE